MELIVIDPRMKRVRRRHFIRDIIIPNIGAFIAILVIRNLGIGQAGDIAIAAIAGVLLWSANIGVPMARLQDLGVPGWWHLVVAVVIFLLTTIGPVSGLDELMMRIADWVQVVRGQDSVVPPVDAQWARVGAIIGGVQFAVLAFIKGEDGPNRWGPDPKLETE